MQDKELHNPKEKRNWRKLIGFGKVLVTILIISYIYNTFQKEQKGISDVGHVLKKILIIENAWTIILMLLLVPANWALESLKWQQLAMKVVKLSFWDAFRGTLTGLAVGVAAPAQLGDTIGRVAALRSDKRLEAIGAAVVSNGIQFYVSIVGGTVGWFYLRKSISLDMQTQLFTGCLLIFLIALGCVVTIFRRKLHLWKPTKPLFKNFHSYFHIIGEYTTSELLMATFYGSLRYMVFLSQFVLALSLFEFSLGVPELSACVALIFLAKTVIPAVNVLGDLGLREFTALFIFKQYNLPAEEIITATFGVWIINVLGPILVGIFLIWKYKWNSAKNG